MLAMALYLLVVWVSTPAHADTVAQRAFDRAIYGWSLGPAEAALRELPPSAERDFRAAQLEFFAARYEEANELFGQLLARQDELSPSLRSQADEYRGLATRATRVFSESSTIISPSGRFEAVFANRKDEILAQYLFDALELAYERVGDAVGVKPRQRVRFEILDDPAELAEITMLPLDSVYTTGTVGITKYARVMMASPRVLIQGYAWLDTAVHEYVHYLVTLRTANAAPVWMQEGLAKLLESRWRRDDPEPLSPGAATLIKNALDRDNLVTLEEMHPSIALLPSQERAALAYAEVKTMLEFLWARSGARGLGEMLDRMADGGDASEALAAAFGASFSSFHDQWKQRLAKLTAQAGGSRFERRRFRDPDAAADEDDSLRGDVFSHLDGGRARQYARIGVLLQLRNHKRAALIEYEKARTVDSRAAGDPKLSRRMGELYLEFSHFERAAELLIVAARDDPDDPNLSAAEALARLRTGDVDGARKAVERAIRINPFVPRIHCVLADLADDPETRRRERAHCR